MKPAPKGHTLYDSIYERCSEEANLERQKADQRLPRTDGAGVWREMRNDCQ